jgi:hypothetical protein
MTSFRQFEANRRNARKSTGPITQEGKERSRCNAVRHGLTAETVIGALEDAEDYKAFEATIIADYDAQSTVERELVLRLANLLWRLRRATTIETGLFEIQASHLREFRKDGRDTIQVFRQANLISCDRDPASRDFTNAIEAVPSSEPNSIGHTVDPTVEPVHCFLRLANSPNFPLDRLSRYETNLWRQVRLILLALDALDRRKPQERRCHFPCR